MIGTPEWSFYGVCFPTEQIVSFAERAARFAPHANAESEAERYRDGSFAFRRTGAFH